MGRIGKDAPTLDTEQLQRIKLLCEMWIGYWQYAVLSRNLKSFLTKENEQDELELLTTRQQQILTLLASGITANECAKKLQLSRRTIDRMLDKLGLDSSVQLIQFAIRNGLVTG